MAAEGHARLSTPLYNIAFVLLGLASVLGGTFSRLGYAKRIAIYAVTGVLIRIVGFAIQAACAEAAILNVLQYAIPLAASWWGWRQLFPSRLVAPSGGSSAPVLQPV